LTQIMPPAGNARRAGLGPLRRQSDWRSTAPTRIAMTVVRLNFIKPVTDRGRGDLL